MPTTPITTLIAMHATDRATQTITDLHAEVDAHMADARRDRTMGFFNAAERHEAKALAAHKRAKAIAARLALITAR